LKIRREFCPDEAFFCGLCPGYCGETEEAPGAHQAESFSAKLKEIALCEKALVEGIAVPVFLRVTGHDCLKGVRYVNQYII
jgi:hypothetical protein